MSKVQTHRFGVGTFLVLMLALCALLLASGCGKEEPGTPAAKAGGAAKGEQKLTVFVPCSIFGPFANVLDEYKAAHPGVKIEFDSGNSVVHMRTVMNKGARPDVYMATGPLEANPLVDAGLVVDGSRRLVSSDTVVLAVPKGNTAGVRSIEDLSGPRVKMIAVPDPQINSCGKFAIEAFKHLGVWDKIKDKVVYTELGRTARKYVIDGKVDAGIMYRSCLYEELQPTDKIIAPGSIVTVADLLGEAQMPEMGSPGYVLKASRNPELAQGFLDFLASAAAQKQFGAWRVIQQEGTAAQAEALKKGQAPVVEEAPEPSTVIDSNKQVLLQAYYPFNEQHQYIADFLQSLPKKYGGSVKVELIDFREGKGYDKWRASGLTCAGIFLNGKYSVNVNVDGEVKNVRFLRRPGMGWEEAELEAAVVQALTETKPED